MQILQHAGLPIIHCGIEPSTKGPTTTIVTSRSYISGFIHRLTVT